jgi:Sperm-tail PG-rich repeat
MKFVGVSAPAWTILGKKEQKKKVEDYIDAVDPANNEIPGDAKTFGVSQLYPSAPQWSFNKSKSHIHLPKAKTAEPGQRPENLDPKKWREYLKPGTMFSKGARLGNSKKHNEYSTPGPGQYGADLREVDPSVAMPCFSMAYKQDATTGQDINQLAPNAYEPQFKHREMNRCSSFGKAPKAGLEHIARQSFAPGPGMYEIPRERPNTSSQKGTFGKSKRNDLYKHGAVCTPENDYNVELHTIAYKAAMIKGDSQGKNNAKPNTSNMQRLTSDNITGGSGTENIGFNGTKKNAPAWRFGSSTRPPLNGEPQCMVGPGEHLNATKSLKPAVQSVPKFSRAKRRPLNDNEVFQRGDSSKLKPDRRSLIDNMNKVHPLFNGPLFSFRGKFESVENREAMKVPGPGHYEFHPEEGLYFPNSTAVIIGTAERDPVRRREFLPGPGTYNIKRTLSSASGIKFPKSRRQPPGNDVDPDIEVGPGQYKLKSTIPQLQCYEMAKLMQGDGMRINFEV